MVSIASIVSMVLPAEEKSTRLLTKKILPVENIAGRIFLRMAYFSRVRKVRTFASWFGSRR